MCAICQHTLNMSSCFRRQFMSLLVLWNISIRKGWNKIIKRRLCGMWDDWNRGWIRRSLWITRKHLFWYTTLLNRVFHNKHCRTRAWWFYRVFLRKLRCPRDFPSFSLSMVFTVVDFQVWAAAFSHYMLSRDITICGEKEFEQIHMSLWEHKRRNSCCEAFYCRKRKCFKEPGKHFFFLRLLALVCAQSRKSIKFSIVITLWDEIQFDLKVFSFPFFVLK